MKVIIYKVAQEVAQKFNVTLPCLQIEMRSDIPLARGTWFFCFSASGRFIYR